MSDAPLDLAVIVGSTREGRLGGIIARWFLTQVRQRDDLASELVDLAELDLPAAYPSRPGPRARWFIDRVERADAFVVVTPEYNHGYPASLKQAIDLPYREWHAKPIAFVSYGGGRAGGVRAVEQLRQVFAELHTVTVRDTVSLARARRLFDETGALHEPAGPEAAAKTMLDRLAWWGRALREARRSHPYTT